MHFFCSAIHCKVIIVFEIFFLVAGHFFDSFDPLFTWDQKLDYLFLKPDIKRCELNTFLGLINFKLIMRKQQAMFKKQLKSAVLQISGIFDEL